MTTRYSQEDNSRIASDFSLSLSARVSSDSIPGTWGFGLWNHPFGLSIGFGGSPWRLPALPNAVWFFGASEENYLSFRDTQRFVFATLRSPFGDFAARYSGKWISRTNISCAEVSSIIDSCGVGASLLAKGDA